MITSSLPTGIEDVEVWIDRSILVGAERLLHPTKPGEKTNKVAELSEPLGLSSDTKVA